MSQLRSIKVFIEFSRTSQLWPHFSIVEYYQLCLSNITLERIAEDANFVSLFKSSGSSLPSWRRSQLVTLQRKMPKLYWESQCCVNRILISFTCSSFWSCSQHEEKRNYPGRRAHVCFYFWRKAWQVFSAQLERSSHISSHFLLNPKSPSDRGWGWLWWGGARKATPDKRLVYAVSVENLTSQSRQESHGREYTPCHLSLWATQGDTLRSYSVNTWGNVNLKTVTGPGSHILNAKYGNPFLLAVCPLCLFLCLMTTNSYTSSFYSLV